MKRTHFQHYSLNQSNRKNLEISNFVGVDFSTPRFQMSNNHAIDLLNYIYKDGYIQKRNGIEKIFQKKETEYIEVKFDGEITNEHYINPINFNNIWKFVADDDKEHIIAHIGNLLYEIKFDFLGNIICEPILAKIGISNYPLCYKFENFKSQAFVGGKKLWFLGGNKFMVIYFDNGSNTIKITPVENSIYAIVPTTSMSITYKNSIVNKRQSLDNVNLLSKFRKNLLISGTSKNENELTRTQYFEYTLDSPLICENEDKDMANFKVVIEERGTINNE